MSVVEEPKIEDAQVHIRGSVHNLGELAPRGFLQVATVGTVPPLPGNESGRRELAAWLAGRDNPLTARVIVNRVWHWLFGAGLVRTTDNFGTTGETPVASRAARRPGGPLHRGRLVDQDAGAADRAVAHLPARRRRRSPGARGRPREPAALADEPPPARRRVHPRHDPGGQRPAQARDGRPELPRRPRRGLRLTSTPSTRRSVYCPVFRNALPELFEVFDFADPSMVVGRRNVSTVAPQALFLMNHPFVLEQSRHAARRLLAETEPGDDDRRIERAYRLALGRPPSERERRIALEFLAGPRMPATAPRPVPRRPGRCCSRRCSRSIDFRYVD